MNKNKPDGDENPANGYLKYSGMGFQMIAIIGGLTYAGYWVDEKEHHQVQWVTAALALTGVFISLYVVIRSIKAD
jgi:hypothetical protein